MATANEKVFFAQPWQKFTHPITSFCVARLQARRQATTCLNFGDAYVIHTRNRIAEKFLDSECDWMFTIDDDMVVPFGNAKWFNSVAEVDLPEKFAGLNAVDRLLSHRKTLVGGLYFGRHPRGSPMYGEGGNPQEAALARKAPADVLKPTRWIATGCMLVHRSVFLDIERRFPRLARKNGKRGQWFTPTEHSVMEVLDQCREVLSSGPLNGELAYKVQRLLESTAAEAKNQSPLGVGEDVQFCHRAQLAGHQPYVDMGLVCGHIGHAIYWPWNTRPE